MVQVTEQRSPHEIDRLAKNFFPFRLGGGAYFCKPVIKLAYICYDSRRTKFNITSRTSEHLGAAALCDRRKALAQALALLILVYVRPKRFGEGGLAQRLPNLKRKQGEELPGLDRSQADWPRRSD